MCGPAKLQDAALRVAFQGSPGAYSDIACREVFPGCESLPCPSFEDTFAAARSGEAGAAVLPIENSLAGRVADIHHLLPTGDLWIFGEHYQRIEHCLLAPRGVGLNSLTKVHSHAQALGQCRNLIRHLGLQAIAHADTAAAASEVALRSRDDESAIASPLAAQLYDLDILQRGIEDARPNTTRFLLMALRDSIPPRHTPPEPGDGLTITSFLFRVRSVPAALFKALGGFATNNVNMTKLESYLVDGRFTAAQFYADVEGHIREPRLERAFEELKFFARPDSVRILGVYPAHPFRQWSCDETDSPAGATIEEKTPSASPQAARSQ